MTHKPVNFASLTVSFRVSFSKLFKLWPWMQRLQTENSFPGQKRYRALSRYGTLAFEKTPSWKWLLFSYNPFFFMCKSWLNCQCVQVIDHDHLHVKNRVISTLASVQRPGHWAHKCKIACWMLACKQLPSKTYRISCLVINFYFFLHSQTTGKFKPVFLPVMFAAEVGDCCNKLIF